MASPENPEFVKLREAPAHLNCTVKHFIDVILDAIVGHVEVASPDRSPLPSLTYHMDAGRSQPEGGGMDIPTGLEIGTNDTKDKANPSNCTAEQLERCAVGIGDLASLEGLGEYLMQALHHGVASPGPHTTLGSLGWGAVSNAMLENGTSSGGSSSSTSSPSVDEKAPAPVLELGGGTGAGFQIVCDDRALASGGGGGGGGAFGAFGTGLDRAEVVRRNGSIGGGSGGGVQFFWPVNATEKPWESLHWKSWSTGGGGGCGTCKQESDDNSTAASDPKCLTCGSKFDDVGAVDEDQGRKVVAAWREGPLRQCYEAGKLAVIGGGGGGSGGAECCKAIPSLNFGFGFRANLLPPAKRRVEGSARRLHATSKSASLSTPLSSAATPSASSSSSSSSYLSSFPSSSSSTSSSSSPWRSSRTALAAATAQRYGRAAKCCPDLARWNVTFAGQSSSGNGDVRVARQPKKASPATPRRLREAGKVDRARGAVGGAFRKVDEQVAPALEEVAKDVDVDSIDPFEMENTGHQTPGGANRRPRVDEMIGQQAKRIGVDASEMLNLTRGPRCKTPAWLEDSESEDSDAQVPDASNLTTSGKRITKEPEAALQYIFKYNPLHGFLTAGANACGSWNRWCCLCHHAQRRIACLPEEERSKVDFFLTEDCCESRMAKNKSSPGFVVDATPPRNQTLAWSPNGSWVKVAENSSDSYNWTGNSAPRRTCEMMVVDDPAASFAGRSSQIGGGLIGGSDSDPPLLSVGHASPSDWPPSLGQTAASSSDHVTDLASLPGMTTQEEQSPLSVLVVLALTAIVALLGISLGPCSRRSKRGAVGVASRRIRDKGPASQLRQPLASDFTEEGYYVPTGSPEDFGYVSSACGYLELT